MIDGNFRYVYVFKYAKITVWWQSRRIAVECRREDFGENCEDMIEMIDFAEWRYVDLDLWPCTEWIWYEVAFECV